MPSMLRFPLNVVRSDVLQTWRRLGNLWHNRRCFLSLRNPLVCEKFTSRLRATPQSTLPHVCRSDSLPNRKARSTVTRGPELVLEYHRHPRKLMDYKGNSLTILERLSWVYVHLFFCLPTSGRWCWVTESQQVCKLIQGCWKSRNEFWKCTLREPRSQLSTSSTLLQMLPTILRSLLERPPRKSLQGATSLRWCRPWWF